MSQRFVRCHHCGLLHSLSDEVCPNTGKFVQHWKRVPDETGLLQGKEREPSQPRVSSSRPPILKRILSAPLAKHGSERGLVGQVVGAKYRVLGVIGEGGMGTVYEAEHQEIGRRVAIKVLNHTHVGRKEAIARFHQEARAAGTIGHPNICEIYDVGRLSNGAPYLVMERMYGKTLADRINIEGALPFEDIVSIVTQVLSALVAAHEKQIIHRDIKPENVFLTERVGCAPVVKLLDFGISKSVSDQGALSLTRTGMVMGTPFYMAPEQARGEHIDHRIDLYACGVMLYEVLTGRRPFFASNYSALVVQVLTVRPRDPREIRPAIPAAFVPIVFKALSKKREDRFNNAAEFIEALSQAQAEINRGPTTAQLRQLAEQLLPPKRSPLIPSDDCAADSTDIPVVFSETDPGHLLEGLDTGEVLVDLDPDSQPVSVDDFLLVGEKLPVGELQQRQARLFDAGEDAPDTLVDPSGAIKGELWTQLDKSDQRRAREVIQGTRRSGGQGPVSLESIEVSDTPEDELSTIRIVRVDVGIADQIINSLDDPDGGTTEADCVNEEGRLRMGSTIPEAIDEREHESEERPCQRPERDKPKPHRFP